jgi:hypothetical protein
MSMTITYRQRGELTEGKPENLQYAIERAVHTINRADESIREGLATVERRIADTRAALDHGGYVSELGVFQHTPADVDRACALRFHAWQMLAALIGADEARGLAEASLPKNRIAAQARRVADAQSRHAGQS